MSALTRSQKKQLFHHVMTNVLDRVPEDPIWQALQDAISIPTVPALIP